MNDKEYILYPVRDGIWKVYHPKKKRYIECRTDALDNFRDYLISCSEI